MIRSGRIVAEGGESYSRPSKVLRAVKSLIKAFATAEFVLVDHITK